MDKDELFTRTIGLILKIYEFEDRLSNNKDDDEITALQFNMLKILYFSNAKSVGSLSQCLNINLPNCSREIKKLLLKNMVTKTCQETDKRKIFIDLTHKGRDKVSNFLEETKTQFLIHTIDMDLESVNKCINSIITLENELIK